MRFALCIALLAFPVTAGAVEASARLGVSTPQASKAQTGPSLGVSLAIPLRARIQIVGSADWSTHGIPDSASRIESLTGTLGLEVGLDLAPVVPVVSIGPVYQYAWRRGTDAASGSFGGYVGVGIKATLFEHLRLGLHARYLTASFSAGSFPAFATFVLEVGFAG